MSDSEPRRKQTGGRWDPAHRYLYFLAMRPTMAITCGDTADAVLTAVNEIGGEGADINAFLELLGRRVPILVDSGVYNLAARHAEAHDITHDEALRTPIEQLDGFKELWERYTSIVTTYGDLTWGYIELDLGGHVQKRKTRARLEEMGLRPIPVYHALNDPVEYFDELAEGYDRICVGNLVQASPETRKRILCSIYLRRRRFPGLRWIHALGVTPNQVLNSFPFESVDSTTWMATIRFVQGCTPRACLRTLGGMGKGFRYTHDAGPGGTAMITDTERIRATTNRRRTVFCTLQFEGFHRWPEAPPTVEHLFNLHRHVFHVRVDFEVQEDRGVEFIQAKSVIADFIEQLQRGGENAGGEPVDLEDLQTWSCESWALEILDKFASWGAFKCEVSEDGENGAVVYA